jgi:enoyl-CoA hydratase
VSRSFEKNEVRNDVADDLVRLDVHPDGVGVITLSNPPLNLITLTLTSQLIDMLGRIADTAKIRALVVTGSGTRAFCAGADITEFADVREDVVPMKLRRENAAMSALAALPIPTIAAIGAVALGGGSELAIACDLRIMDSEAKMGFPEILLGVFPGSGGVFRLPRIVGVSRALDLLYTGRMVDAEEAHSMGLVNEVAEHGTALERAIEKARVLAARPALALSLIKAGAHAALAESDEAAVRRTLDDSDRVFTGPDVAEGIAAFLGKRPPAFTAPRVPASADRNDPTPSRHGAKEGN